LTARPLPPKIESIFPVYDIRTDIRPTVAEIDLLALRRNADAVRAALGDPGVGMMAVVKADAYGHGAVPCARALERKVWGFAVSLVEEGVELRRGGIEAPIVVLGCFYGLSHRDVVAYRLTPVVADAGDLGRLQSAAADLGAPRVPVHLKLDTGMSRLGVRPERLDDFVAALQQHPGISLTGLCTHLSDADGLDIESTELQLERLGQCQRRLGELGVRPGVVHVANTAAAIRFPRARFDLVRPGLGMFGIAPDHTALSPLWPVMSLKTRIVALREVPAGTGVSYGRMTRTTTATRVATLPLGYADGYTRRMSQRAEVLCGGRRCAVLGPITMDMTMIDVTAVPAVKIGDEVVIIGSQRRPDAGADDPCETITVSDLARWADTIPWEVCCTISKRVPRVYIGEVRP
jgi:alanine racemase